MALERVQRAAQQGLDDEFIESCHHDAEAQIASRQLTFDYF
jgi:hypothetical protein